MVEQSVIYRQLKKTALKFNTHENTSILKKVPATYLPGGAEEQFYCSATVPLPFKIVCCVAFYRFMLPPLSNNPQQKQCVFGYANVIRPSNFLLTPISRAATFLYTRISTKLAIRHVSGYC